VTAVTSAPGAHTVTIRASGIDFHCTPDQTVLEAAEQAGLRIPYSCRKGVCSSCEGGLTRGEAEIRGQGPVSGPVQRVRLCQTRPRSDLEIVPTRVERRGPPQRKTLPAHVFRILRPSPDVTVLRLRFPIGRRAPFRAGQYLRVLLDGPDGGDSRNFSMANAPQDNDGVELHVRHVPGGRFSDGIVGRLTPGDVLHVELPYGEFCIDEQSPDDDGTRPLVLLATGTGFGPIRSIVTDHVRRRLDRPMHLYWGGRRRDDLYDAALATRWARELPWFSFTPVLTDPDPEWAGRRGLVHRAVLEDLADLSEHEVFACGNPAMIGAAEADFTAEAGLPLAQYHRDAYLPSGEPFLSTSREV
jgi:NAD(P)H-flavin reductase/ferredoxin